MTVKELCDKHKLSAKNMVKHCRKGRFSLDGVNYLAKDVSKPGSKRAKWIIELEPQHLTHRKADGTADKCHTQTGGLKEAKLAIGIKKDQATIQKIEQEIKEKKLEKFMEYLSLEKEIMHHCSAELKEFVVEHLKTEQDIEEWNESWSIFIETVYNRLSKAIFESL